MGAELPGLKDDPLDRPVLGVVTKPAIEGIYVGGRDSLSHYVPVAVDRAHMS